jgi:hypothetical protein
MTQALRDGQCFQGLRTAAQFVSHRYTRRCTDVLLVNISRYASLYEVVNNVYELAMCFPLAV